MFEELRKLVIQVALFIGWTASVWMASSFASLYEQSIRDEYRTSTLERVTREREELREKYHKCIVVQSDCNSSLLIANGQVAIPMPPMTRGRGR